MTRSPRARPSRMKGTSAPAASSGPSKRPQTCRCMPRSAAPRWIAAEGLDIWPTLTRQDRSVYLVYSGASMNGEDQRATKDSAAGQALLGELLLRGLPRCAPETIGL